jgi:predicted metal-dependent enzyme (double-stranded beta helix superfamily)
MVERVKETEKTEATYTVEAFIEDVKGSLAETGVTEEGLGRLGRLMQRLVREGDAIQPGDLERIEAGEKPSRFYSSPDGGLTLVLGRFGPEAPTRVHNHGSWGVACIYAGHDLYTAWRRQDSGNGTGPARLENLGTRVLGPGEYVTWMEPPQDLHSQQGYNGEVAWEYVLFGHDTMGHPRLYFDIAHDEAWEGPMSELRAPYPPGRSAERAD